MSSTPHRDDQQRSPWGTTRGEEGTPELEFFDDEYFAALATIVNDGLNECGYRYCPGDVMASNTRWRQPLRVWKEYFNRWIAVPEEKALMHANIFFDLRSVAGKSWLVDELKKSVRDDARRNEIFLALMAKNSEKKDASSQG